MEGIVVEAFEGAVEIGFCLTINLDRDEVITPIKQIRKDEPKQQRYFLTSIYRRFCDLPNLEEETNEEYSESEHDLNEDQVEHDANRIHSLVLFHSDIHEETK